MCEAATRFAVHRSLTATVDVRLPPRNTSTAALVAFLPLSPAHAPEAFVRSKRGKYSEMCDSKVPAAARCARRESSSRRPRLGLGFWLVVTLIGTSCGARGARGQEDYDYGYGQAQPPMRAGGGGEGGGIMKPLAAVATSFFTMKLLFSSRRKSKSNHSQVEVKKWEMMKREDLAQINQQFNEMEATLSASLNEKLIQSKELEQYLYSLPDVNRDGLITRYEFDKYMNEYKLSHPGLTDRDLPRFEDMDHNNNGHINFHEWEEYQVMAMNSMS
eukprot:jgi/Undpi1/7995/HiC_scaffold_24.g10467.m1